MNQEKDKAPPWVRVGDTEAHEDELIGNRAGFELLRMKIDEVFKTGRATIQEAGMAWIALKIVADDPEKKKSESKAQGWVALAFFVAAMVFALFVFIVGLGTLWSWWK